MQGKIEWFNYKKLDVEYKINNNISKSCDKVSESLRKLKESGQTALGRGPHVMLCTDGLVNVGVDWLDVVETDENVVNANVWWHN